MKQLYMFAFLAIFLSGCSSIHGNNQTENTKLSNSVKFSSGSEEKSYKNCLEKAKIYCGDHRFLCWTAPEKWCLSSQHQRRIKTVK